ncbi:MULTISPECIES: hypothetical protein [Legionella]|uniref:Enhanced entry protein EnhB n=1 Tax=Legionella maceachernii TaxID=466 RepID=A0A0W0WFH9_9GAMM|nr:hypothetical protein [Legionella maceachernii]KTD31093.1 enhanced entry protein EnhB [Legionella maceachernii]SJZ98634.1 hypothetical protein SAMN02745128_01664 [Legionella maceachernii]SUP01171.1 Uncharacterised protein [Legionella maceachernii]
MNTITKNISVSLFLTLLSVGIANAKSEKEEKAEKDDNKPPIGCYNSGYQFELEALHLHPGGNGQNQSMYFLFNTLGQPVNLFQMRDEESSRSMYLNHVIGPHEWGILSTNEKKVKFICSVPSKKSPYGQVVDCAQTLRVCEYTNVRYGLNNRGNYWLANSSTRNGAVNAVVHYGIIPGM